MLFLIILNLRFKFPDNTQKIVIKTKDALKKKVGKKIEKHAKITEISKAFWLKLKNLLRTKESIKTILSSLFFVHVQEEIFFLF